MARSGPASCSLELRPPSLGGYRLVNGEHGPRQRAKPACGFSNREFEVVTTVELVQPKGESRIWLPAVLTRNPPNQRALSNRFAAAGGTARLTEDKQNALGIVSATYPVGTKSRLTLASRVLLKNYPVDLSSHANCATRFAHRAQLFLQPNRSPGTKILKGSRI